LSERALIDPRQARARLAISRPKPRPVLCFDRRQRNRRRNLGNFVACRQARRGILRRSSLRRCIVDRRAASEFHRAAIRANDRGGLQLLRRNDSRRCYRQARDNARDSPRAAAAVAAVDVCGWPCSAAIAFCYPRADKRSDDSRPALSTAAAKALPEASRLTATCRQLLLTIWRAIVFQARPPARADSSCVMSPCVNKRARFFEPRPFERQNNRRLIISAQGQAARIRRSLAELGLHMLPRCGAARCRLWQSPRCLSPGQDPRPSEIPQRHRDPRRSACANRMQTAGLPPRDPMQIERPPMLLAVRSQAFPPTWKMRLRIGALDLLAAFRCLDLRVDRCKRAVDRISRPDRRGLRDRLSKSLAKCCRSTSQPDQRRKHRPARLVRENLPSDSARTCAARVSGIPGEIRQRCP